MTNDRPTHKCPTCGHTTISKASAMTHKVVSHGNGNKVWNSETGWVTN
jgi:hypothetical protein